MQVDAFIAGLSDALSDTVQMDEAAMTTAIQLFVQQQREAAQSLADNLAASEAFWLKMASKMVSLPYLRVAISGSSVWRRRVAHYHRLSVSALSWYPD